MSRKKMDKIFDNKFDESEYDGKSINFNIEPGYIDDRDSESVISDQILMDRIDELIQNSKFNEFNKLNEDGKIPKLNKVQICEVYSFINDEVKDFSVIEIFSAVSEYFDIQGSKFYNSLSNSHKDELLNMLDESRGIKEGKHIDKLF